MFYKSLLIEPLLGPLAFISLGNKAFLLAHVQVISHFKTDIVLTQHIYPEIIILD